MKKILTLVLVWLSIIGVSGLVSAQLTGSDILDKVKEATQPKTSYTKMKMELYSSAGQKRERMIEGYRKNGEYTKAMNRFLFPATVEGTSFLSLENEEDEDMYLYLPALGSVRKISSSQKNGSFVGTDFTYNDLNLIGEGDYNKDYDASILSENDKEYVLKLVPTDTDIDYKYLKIWIKKEEWHLIKSEFYDERGKLEKILTAENFEKIAGYWTPRKSTMENVQKGTKTVIYMEEITYDKPINDRIFTTRYLSR
ncbi:outer membrane lipoprotein-sorting protein [Orenia metallireducens]|uniref:Outer membrane lipoprotein-sorting protein n=1 Tax=Orenia metallireducens TaxID=1413210 RepID=A0A1C0AAH8_9FIRM|nr:outer membrane lipoprotein-sorting protein [Orenia metallireducens]OCL27286.1 outer membrane lipoprotein-sorting protein [Orenia metallireducens]